MIGCNNLPQVSFCLSSPPFFSQAQLEHDICVSLLKKVVLLRHLSNNITKVFKADMWTNRLRNQTKLRQSSPVLSLSEQNFSMKQGHLVCYYFA